MAKRMATLLWIYLLAAPTMVFAEALNEAPLGMMDPSLAESNLEITSFTPEVTSISMRMPRIVTQEEVVDFETYQVFGIPGEPFVFAEGRPAVPHVTRFYRIPNTGSADLVITAAEYELVENVNVLPLQLDESGFSQLVRDAALYGTDEWYPANVAEMSAPMIMRDFRVVTVTLHPVQVNPVTRQARIYHTLSVDVVANDRPGVNELTNPRPPSGAFVPMYRSVIANLDESALDEATQTPGSIMIITQSNSNALQWAESLAVWKTRRGFKTVIESRTSWSASQMISTIRSAYTSYDPPLEFVVLVGDPSWTYGVPVDGSNYDHSYALGNTGDDLEDIGVGRLSGSSPTEMATINAKIMGYERNPYMADTLWYRRGFFYAGIANSIASNHTLMLWGAQQFRNLTGVRNNNVQYVNGHVDNNLVIQQFNLGINFFWWRGSWLSQMEPSLANSTNPGWKLPMCLTVTCGANEYVNSLGIAEAYLVAGSPSQPRGGICGIGTTTAGTHAPENVTITGGLMYGIANMGILHIGHALNYAKTWMASAFGASSGASNNYHRWVNLMGDPSVALWTDVPAEISVIHPTQLNVGARHVAVTVRRTADNIPIENAIVVLWKRGADSTWSRGLTNSEGQITLPVSVNTPGELSLTVSKHNHKPYLFGIPCNAVEHMPMLSSYTLDDDNSGGSSGNGDGVLNPGETIDLPIYIRNFGTATTAQNVRARLTSNNPRVTVTVDSSSYPNIAPGDSALGNRAFRILVSPTMQNNEPVLLTLTVTSAMGQVSGSIQLRCRTANLLYTSHQFSSAFGPGLTRQLRVTVQNTGQLPLTGATGRLISYSPFVQVDDPESSFGNIPAGGSGNNAADQFTLTANTMTFRGHQAPMLLVLTALTGETDTVQFTISVGSAASTDPTGPDAYGYYAYDNTDVDYERHPDFAYTNISAGIGTNLNLNDTGEQTTINQPWSTARQLPFTFRFYGQNYDTVTISSNGWIAFGNQAWNTVFRNYRIPAMIAPDAMIAPYWDDLRTSGSGLGVWQYYDEAEHRYIVQWKAQNIGSSPTNLDFQVILYDTAYHPTFGGNGLILVQYQNVQMNLPGDPGDVAGCTIGIQGPGGLVGLSYAYQTTYSPGAATVSNGRAILFTTDARMMFGDIRGRVLNNSTGLPLPGATVSIDGFAYHDETDVNGNYLIENVLIGSYTVRAAAYRFNDATVADVIVELDSTEIINFSLRHPELALSDDSLSLVTIPEEPIQTTFMINNAGDGVLDYAITVLYAGDENPSPWDSVGAIPVSQLSNNYLMSGCEFIGDYWWVTGGNPSGTNYLYKFDLNGQLAGTVPQPSTTDLGWFDLAYDGEYIYGSDSHVITGIDESGQVQVTIPSPVNPTRAIAYDPTLDHFWVADYTWDLWEIDRLGNIVQQVEMNRSLAITGLAWNPIDPNGFKLYIFSQDGSGSQLIRVTRMHPLSHVRETVVDLPGRPGDRSGGCTITPAWNSTLLVFAGIINNTSGEDRLGIFEMDFNTTWINVAPAAFTVPGGGSREIQVRIDPTILRPAEYRVSLRIVSTILDTTTYLPVRLLVNPGAVEDDAVPGLPQEYALHQNYPNPFNPVTTIRYELKEDGPTRLAVYNLLGELVTELVNTRQAAGKYEVQFNAAALPSGMYFYRIESGGFRDVAKMVLMK